MRECRLLGSTNEAFTATSLGMFSDTDIINIDISSGKFITFTDIFNELKRLRPDEIDSLDYWLSFNTRILNYSKSYLFGDDKYVAFEIV